MSKDDKRKLSKKKVLLKIVAEGLINYKKSLDAEVGLPFGIFSEISRISTDQRVNAVSQISYKLFNLVGGIDKRRSRRFNPKNKPGTYLIQPMVIKND